MKNILPIFISICISLSLNCQTVVNFGFTGSSQNFVVPATVCSITVQAWGAGGAGGAGEGGSGLGGNGGGGAYSFSVLSVTPGQVLTVKVGRGGSGGQTHCGANGTQGIGSGAGGNFGIGIGGNGGNNGGCAGGGAGGGGGTGILNASLVPLVIAGGGGGGGGGGSTGAGGRGGTASAGGGIAGAGPGGIGGLLSASTTNNGLIGASEMSEGGGGGGGGGGLLGGGGGGIVNATDRGGGGGASGTSMGSTITNGALITPGNSAILTPLCASCSRGGAGGPAWTNGSTGGNGFLTISHSICTTLPISIFINEVVCESSLPKIIWSTFSEQNNNYFSIARSKDGESFQNIGILNSLGNSSSLQSYSFIDHNPLQGLSYYRLSQTDFSTVVTNFEIMSYENNCNELPFEIVALSNPFENTLNLNLKYGIASVVSLSIYDNLGQIVKNVFENEFMEGEASSISLKTNDLPQSVYFVSGRVNNKPFNLKLIKISN
jgi:hypothetical protein